MGRCMVVWGVGCRKWHASLGCMVADNVLHLTKKHGGRNYEKLALRKKKLLQGDLPPDRTAKETGTSWKTITLRAKR